MGQIGSKLVERRKYIRLDTPCEIIYTLPDDDKLYRENTTNISPNGLRFQTRSDIITPGMAIEIRLNIKGLSSPIHATAKVVWKKRLSLDDASLFDVGLEIVSIEDDNKNTFLKFLCDSLYNIPKEGYEK